MAGRLRGVFRGLTAEGYTVIDSQTKKRIRITAILLGLLAASVLALFFYSVLGSAGSAA